MHFSWIGIPDYCFLCCIFFWWAVNVFAFFLLSKAIAYHIKTSICLCNNDLSNPSNYDKHNNLRPSLLVAPWETFHAFCGLSADFFLNQPIRKILSEYHLSVKHCLQS